MKKLISGLLLMVCSVMLLAPVGASAAAISGGDKGMVKPQAKAIEYKKTITTKEIEQALGRKMTGVEKFAFKLNRKKLVKALNAPSALESSDRTNTWAIVGFVTSLLIGPLGVIFSAIALGQIKKTGERGKGLAIAGLIIGIVGTVLLIAAL